MQETTSINMQAALSYAGIGLHILPAWWIRADKTCACGATACKSPGKHPIGKLARNGQDDSTTDPAVITAWWSQYPTANIAAYLAPSNLCAIDIDPRNGGSATIDDLEAKHGSIASDLLQFTGGGGEHRLFKAPEGLTLPGKLGDGIDLKSNGYLMLEPSNHVSGGVYAWEASSDPRDGVAPSALPGWICDLGRPAQGLPAMVQSVATTVVDAATVRDLRSALSHLRADDYHQWVDIGHALKELGEVGRGLWLDWSQSSDKFRPSDATKWDTFKPTKTGYAVAFARAQAAGWVNPATKPNAAVGNDTGQMRLVSIADVLSNPQPPHPFMWGPYIPAEALTLLSGHGGTGKSGFVLQLAVHVAMGMDFLGFPVQRTKTLFFSAEDSASILRLRVADICRNHGIDPVQLAQHLHVMDATDAAVLWQSDGPRKPGEATPNYTALHDYIEQNEIGFLSVDNASDTFGADRFDKSQVTQFVRALVRLVRARRGGALLLSHVNRTTAAPKGGRKEPSGESYSDSVAWHNAARSRLFLAGAEGGDDLTLEHEKSNYGKKGETLNLRRMEGCGFEPAAQIQIGSPAQGLIDQMRLTPILTMIEEFYQRGEYASTSTGGAHNNLYKLLRNERSFPKGLGKEDFWTLIRDAERQGGIHRESYVDAYRKDRERWRVGFAPSAPSCAFLDEGAEHARGAPSAPSCVGGVGGERSAKESAKESANDPSPVPKTRKARTMKAQKVA